MDDLGGRSGIVTGAASGIGLAIAIALAKAGYQFLMTDIDGGALRTAAAPLRSGGAVVETLELDVRDDDAVQGAAERAVEQFGGLHIAVNNAGVVNGGKSWELPLEDWRQVFDVNLWGVIHGIRAFVPRLLESGEGHVVNVSSLAGVIPIEGVGPYTASKHAVLGLSDVLRAELASAGGTVGVSVVLPGMIKTSMNPVGSVEPDVVGAKVLDAIVSNRPYVFTDGFGADTLDLRFEAILEASRSERMS